MAATDARPVPRKNTAYRLPLAIRKNDGTLITTWAGQDSEVSLDGEAFADCTNEATEIGTSGCGYLDLTADEMNADSVIVKITVTNTDALPVVIVLYPEEAGDMRSDVTHWKGSAAPDNTGDAYARLGAPAGASIAADIATVDTVVDAIKAKTDNLPASPAAVGSAMTLTEAYDAAKTAAQAGSAMTLTTGERTSVADAILTRDLKSITTTVTYCLYTYIMAALKSAVSGTSWFIQKPSGAEHKTGTVTTDVNGNITGADLGDES